MVIQFYMRGYNTSAPGAVGYVDWVVNDVPDSSASYVPSPYVPGNITNIIVNRVVQSPVNNFLKPGDSTIITPGYNNPQDQYLFHLNSYDWINPEANAVTGPIAVPPPAQPVGIAVVRGSTTNTALPTPFIPSPYASIFWEESSPQAGAIAGWNFAFINDDGTIGPVTPVSMGSLNIVGHLGVQDLSTDPESSTGLIRITNNQVDATGNTGAIKSRNTNNTGDITLILADSTNRVNVGSAADPVYVPGTYLRVDNFISNGNPTLVSAVGFIRNPLTTPAIITAKGTGADITLLGVSSNLITLGDSVNTGIVYNTATGHVHNFEVNGVSQVQISLSNITFPGGAPGVVSPVISQANGTTTPGQLLTIQAQNSTAGGSTGGGLNLTSGTGTTVAGNVQLQTGGVTREIVTPTGMLQLVGATGTSTYAFAGTADPFGTITNPTIKQNDLNMGSGIGSTLTVQAQNSVGATSTGGILALTSGTGTSTSGQVVVQTGGLNQIIVSPTFIAPGTTTLTGGSVIIRGSLEVVGTTTTVDSTVVDIIGRVIHANWSDPSVNPNVGVPAQVVGYSVHRGNSSGVPRDGAAWIWSEGVLNSGADGYWRAVTYPGDGVGTDNFSFGNSLNIVGTMASDFSASSDPNPILGFLASTGSFRTSNNTSAVVARTVQASTTLTSTGLTNGSATLPLTPITVASTAAFTSSGSLLIQSSNGPQTVTYTGTSGGNSFTGVVGGSGTIVTGGIVAQTNKSTTFNGANGTSASVASITVVSTVGFPAAGTLRIVSHTSNSATAPVFVQTITYTGGGGAGTAFTGCSGATSGFFFVGDSITSTPAPGISDMPLVGTDFGNRIVYGDPANNTGHVFNTPTGFFYDFQVNSVSQIQLGQADIDASGFSETLLVSPTVNNPRLSQATLPNTGATNGFNLGVFAQNGQQQTGGNNNNNGGNVVVASGAAGTGGGGTAGINGTVDIQTGATLKVRVFPTTTSPTSNNNSILYFENLFRVDTAQTSPLFRQDDNTTNGGTAQNYTVQAQNATGTTSTGGDIINTSGTGTTTAGNNRLQTGGVDRVIVHPAFTEFRDTAEALRITPVSAGTTQITFAATDTAAQINQTQTASTPSAPMTVQSQATTAASGQGGTLTLIAGNATGTTSTGGNLNLTSGSGTTTNGLVNVNIAATLTATFNSVDIEADGYAEWLYAGPTIVNPRLYQTTQAGTGSNNGFNFKINAQAGQQQTGANANNNGGNLILATGSAGTGGSGAPGLPGNMQFMVDSTMELELTDGLLQWGAGVLNPPTINQAPTNASVGANFSIAAQNAFGTNGMGGNLLLSSGFGSLIDGYVDLQVGGITVAAAEPNKFTFFQGRRRHVTQITGTYNVALSDDLIAITTLSAPFTVFLPTFPFLGDCYEIKDTTGNAGTFNVTVNGNGSNIDGVPTFALSQPYAAATFCYTGTSWSIS